MAGERAMIEHVMLPGGVGVSRLCGYDTSGSPHVHLACAEAYVVIGGRGAVQTLTSAGFAEHPLEPGALVTFTPGTVHRLINHGDVEIVVLMANSGLPEAGDAVLTFPLEVLADPERYAEAVTLDGTLESAYRRRDLAIEGFRQLRDNGLDDFYAAAIKLKQPLLETWLSRWETGAMRAARETGLQLEALLRGDPGHLTEAGVTALPGPVERGRLGMCGVLDMYQS
jgi:mannose-6-phosphate isomerase-like protein (cupin superfamily)